MTVPNSTSLLKKLHWQRFSWFSFMITGLLAIQLLQPSLAQVLPAATSFREEALLSATNKSRNQYQLMPLKLDANLTQAAQAKAQDMLSKNYWSHNSPNGVEPWQFIKTAGYAYKAAGENLAYGFTSEPAIINAWMASEGHRVNMLGEYSDIGFGFATGDFQGGKNTIVVAIYAAPQSNANQTAFVASSASGHVSNQFASINNWQSWTQGSIDWTFLLTLLVVGGSIIGFSLTHRRLLEHSWSSGKQFAAIHPVFDAVILVAVVTVLGSVATGFIA